MTSWRVGVDVGGTFTDRAALAADGSVSAHKVLSTPSDQGEGVVASLDGLEPAAALVHGTTVVTNLLLERAGARVVLCATEGATDLLQLRRQERAALYDLTRHHPAPLVADSDVVPVPERITPRGVERTLSAADVATVTQAVLALAPDVVVIALLHAYADPTHERMLAESLARARPGLEIVTSHDVLPEIREYERCATAVAEGYARPAVQRYLARLSERLEAVGQPAPAVMMSNGGMLPSKDAACHAAAMALSGPAGGVVGAAAVLKALGIRDALTMDIGGTSADAGLILEGEPLVESGGEVAGVPIALPRVLVETVSAGGGSVVWVDDGGALRVGPRSAGARPGPAAFGLGGLEATVTDAQLVLGRIAARAMSGGVALDIAAAESAVRTVAEKLGASLAETAAAIVRIADAEMARALRRVSVERGVDPRHCALVAFGGGGPLHACALADALAMSDVIVPPYAGVLSAVGLALAPERHEAAASVLRLCATWTAAEVEAAVDALRTRTKGSARKTLARVRFVGQGHELEVPVERDDDGAAIRERFAALHEARYGFRLDADAEVVALRHEAGEAARAVQFRRSAALPPLNVDADADLSESAANSAANTDAGGPADPSLRLPGPRAIALSDATLWVASGWTASPLEIGGWRLRRDGAPS